MNCVHYDYRTVSLCNADKYIMIYFFVVTNRSGLIKKMFPTVVPPRGGNGQHHGIKMMAKLL